MKCRRLKKYYASRVEERGYAERALASGAALCLQAVRATAKTTNESEVTLRKIKRVKRNQNISNRRLTFDSDRQTVALWICGTEQAAWGGTRLLGFSFHRVSISKSLRTPSLVRRLRTPNISGSRGTCVDRSR